MYEIQRTDTFLKHLKHFKKNKQVFLELQKKIERLQEQPENVGGNLAGALHGKKATRLTRHLRLIFRIEGNIVFLEALDHRGGVYD